MSHNEARVTERLVEYYDTREWTINIVDYLLATRQLNLFSILVLERKYGIDPILIKIYLHLPSIHRRIKIMRRYVMLSGQ